MFGQHAKSDDADVAVEGLSDEQLRIRRWRRDTLLTFETVTMLDARLLSEADPATADLHRMVKMLELGATGEQLRRILL